MRQRYCPLFPELLRQLLFLLMLLALIVLLFRLIHHSPATQREDQLILVMVLVVFHLPALIRSPFYYFAAKRHTPDQIWYPRGSLYSEVYQLLTYAPLTLVLAVSYGRLWTFASIGFANQLPWTSSVYLGMLCFAVFAFTSEQLRKRLSRNEEDSLSTNNAMYLRSSLPRGRLAQALSAFQTAVFGPVFEEIVCRGFFVYYLGQLIGSPWVGVGFGLVVCVWLHWYQGVGRILPVVAFYFCTVLLLYGLLLFGSGLLGAIVFHILCNTSVVLALRNHAKSYVEFIKSCRTAETAKRRERQKDHIHVDVFDPDNFQPWPPVRSPEA